MQAPYLLGQKLYLRPLERDDAPALRDWINDPEVTRTLAIYRPMNLDAERDFIDRVNRSEHDLVLGIVLRVGDRLIGACGLHAIDFKNRHAAFGISIGAKKEWGKGYGTEATALLTRHAFETLNLNRVWLHVYEFNANGIRAYEKAGYRREGVLRQQHFGEGRYWDIHVMGILRDEWRKRHGVGARPAPRRGRRTR